MKLIVLATYSKSLMTFRLPLMRSFVARGWEVVAVGPDSEEEWGGRFGAFGIRYRSVFLQRTGLNPFADMRTRRELRRLFLEESPDRLFCSQAKAVVYGVPAAKDAGVAGVYALISGLGSVFRGHGLKNALVRMVLKRGYRRALALADGVFFQNDDDRDVFVGLGLVKPEKVSMIPGSGVDIVRFTPSPLPSGMVFLMVARLLRDKGVLEYLQACRGLRAAYPSCRCLLVGPYDTNPSAIRPGDLAPYIEDGSVEYFGERDDVRPFLARSSVFVLPSYHEGTPMSVLEALSCGRAVITTDAPGCRETVVDGLNGFMIPTRDAASLRAAMERFVLAPGLAQKMGISSRGIAESRFASDIVNELVYDKLK